MKGGDARREGLSRYLFPRMEVIWMFFRIDILADYGVKVRQSQSELGLFLLSRTQPIACPLVLIHVFIHLIIYHSYQQGNSAWILPRVDTRPPLLDWILSPDRLMEHYPSRKSAVG
ncbi:hypothetical protein Tco_0151101 [Tanacetum coccineum]